MNVVNPTTFTVHASGPPFAGAAIIPPAGGAGNVDFIKCLAPLTDYYVNVISDTQFTIHTTAVDASVPQNPIVPATTGIVDFESQSGLVNLESEGTYGFGVYKSMENGDAVFLSGTVPTGLQATVMNGNGTINGTVYEYFVSVNHPLTGPPTMSFHKDRDDAIASPPVNKIDLTSAGVTGFKVWDYMNEGEYKSMMGESEIYGDYWINPAIFTHNDNWPADNLTQTAAGQKFMWRNYPINHPQYPGQAIKQVWYTNPAFPCVPPATGLCAIPGWWIDDPTWYFRDPNEQNPAVANHPWVNTREINDNTMDPNNNPKGLTLTAPGTTTVPGKASRYWLRQPLTKEFEKYRDADANMTKLYYWKFYENALPR